MITVAEIPLPTGNYNFEQNVVLNGRNIRMEVKWNNVGEYYSLGLYDVDKDLPLFYGVPILLGIDLLANYKLGLGLLVAIDLSNTNQDCGIDDLGDRIRLISMVE